ncbi:hypothetical protein [Pseudoxanthomonas sp. z9]|uniref:hypothetical protein n=1 Tax=Pseudoxanthomonas sp. z9 TaxID=2584942 RepID=UPI0011439EA2|nr:hypothetical protein [Pseudoxanthomonas sp. z9]
MSAQATFVYARLNARLLPLDRLELYEDPLQEALEASGVAEVTGGGTMQRQTGEIEYCGIDLDVYDMDTAVPALCDLLERMGAPRGSRLEFEQDGERREVAFGKQRGLAIYLNGTELKPEVYAESDVNHVWSEIERLMDGIGSIQSYWEGPTETALYLYGDSIDAMRERIASFMAAYPLCERARYEVIA